MGLCSQSNVFFGFCCERPPSWTAFLFCPAGFSWGSVNARQVFPQLAPRPARAAFAFVNLDTQDADLVAPGAFEHSPIYEELSGGATLDLMH
jgi:hypothetical protein